MHRDSSFQNILSKIQYKNCPNFKNMSLGFKYVQACRDLFLVEFFEKECKGQLISKAKSKVLV